MQEVQTTNIAIDIAGLYILFDLVSTVTMPNKQTYLMYQKRESETHQLWDLPDL